MHLIESHWLQATDDVDVDDRRIALGSDLLEALKVAADNAPDLVTIHGAQRRRLDGCDRPVHTPVIPKLGRTGYAGLFESRMRLSLSQRWMLNQVPPGPV
jgi:hypothetical protein